ncbi:MAG: dihydroorotate dehydrogenase electron transfer subunit [Clostridia bacterium]|nr:dihydroorotate dehydrogenase electron transfer subunit [Clostridia bacterium]
MLDAVYLIRENECIAPLVYRMVLEGDVSHITRPGQFVNIRIDGLYLRRPISVCDLAESSFTIIYKVVGNGTEQMSEMQAGQSLTVLAGLGNGYDLSKTADHVAVIGGGVGVPPMFLLAKELIKAGKTVTAILGFNTAAEVFLADEFAQIGADVWIATMDGTAGTKGTVVDAMKSVDGIGYTYSCGPEPMLKAVYDNTDVSGQYSFEKRMGCGFGACMGCSCKTKYGNFRICKEGPILEKEAIIW